MFNPCKAKMNQVMQCIIPLLLLLIVCPCEGQTKDGDGKERLGMKEVKFSELTRDVQIISDLGYPIGKVLRIRGRWKQPQLSKEAGMLFEVAEVEGKAPDHAIELRAANVRPLNVELPMGRRGFEGKWDWTVESPVKEAPQPKSGEEWEMQVVSEGGIVGFPSDVLKQIGFPPSQRPYLGFVPVHYFICIRRIEAR